jgi:hypothetical protein
LQVNQRTSYENQPKCLLGEKCFSLGDRVFPLDGILFHPSILVDNENKAADSLGRSRRRHVHRFAASVALRSRLLGQRSGVVDLHAAEGSTGQRNKDRCSDYVPPGPLPPGKIDFGSM